MSLSPVLFELFMFFNVIRFWSNRMGIVKKRCATCGIVKSINTRMKSCKDCLRKRREERWEQKIEEICNNPEDREYMLRLPVDNAYVCVFVNPFKKYGDKTGKELMKLYLHKNWNKVIPNLHYQYI